MNLIKKLSKLLVSFSNISLEKKLKIKEEIIDA